MSPASRITSKLLEEASYTGGEASQYLQLPVATLRSWLVGQDYRTPAGKKKRFEPVIVPAQTDPLLLSFVNLVEAHVLAAIRRHHEIPLRKVRNAVNFLRQKFGSPRPLAEQRFETDGIELFVKRSGILVSASAEGQVAIREVLEAFLRRVERDPRGLPVKLYPFTRLRESDTTLHDDPRVVVIDPGVSFGRPVIAGTGIPVSILAERYKAGESVDELAKDYGRERLEIEEALRCACAA